MSCAGYLVENTCTRIDKDMYVRVVAHLMKVDLTVLAQDHVGALYGRINRSVEGLVRFLRVTFLEFVPALLTGSFALMATVSQQPRIALAMVGVIPFSLGADALPDHHAEGDPPRPAPDPRGDGRHGRRAARGHRLRPGGGHAPAGGPSGGAGGRASTLPRS